MRPLTAWLEDGYYSITVANYKLITIIRFVSKNCTHLWKSFANKLHLVLHADIRLFVKLCVIGNQTWPWQWSPVGLLSGAGQMLVCLWSCHGNGSECLGDKASCWDLFILSVCFSVLPLCIVSEQTKLCWCSFSLLIYYLILWSCWINKLGNLVL